MPPELLVAVFSLLSSLGTKASLCSLPFNSVPSKPEPISNPLVAGNDITALARSASSLSNKPSTLSDEEWALVLSYRSRGTTGRARRTVNKTMAAKKPASAKAQASKKPARRTRTRSAAKTKTAAAAVSSSSAVGSV